MTRAAHLVLLLLAGCAGKPEPELASPPRRFVSAPVVQSAPAETVITAEKSVSRPPCVKADEIPEEPPLIGNKLTGIARYDIGPLESSARALRKALRKALALLRDCAEGK